MKEQVKKIFTNMIAADLPHFANAREAENLEKISTAADVAALQESFPTITQEKLMWLQDLLQELTFSNHAYGTELRDETAQLYRDMASDATARQSRLKRMWYRYGRCFC